MRREDRREDWNDRTPNYGAFERREFDGLRILRAYYGVQGRTADVTELVHRQVRRDSVSLMVANQTFGGDPAIGADKVLIVVYRCQGMESATAVREGYMLTLSCSSALR